MKIYKLKANCFRSTVLTYGVCGSGVGGGGGRETVLDPSKLSKLPDNSLALARNEKGVGKLPQERSLV